MNYYEILGIDKNATKEQIKAAYKQKVILFHPDKNLSVDTTEDFRKIQTAYEFLSNDKRENNTIDNSELHDYFMKTCEDIFIKLNIREEDKKLFFDTFDFKEFEDDIIVNDGHYYPNIKRIQDKIYKKLSSVAPTILANNWFNILTTLIRSNKSDKI
jgi:hypothetical protein